MTTKIVLCLLCAVVVCAVSTSAQRVPKQARKLVGTWRLLEFADLVEDQWHYPYGEHPRGYIVYDPTGHLHVQIMKMPPLAPFPEVNTNAKGAARLEQKPTAEHAQAAYTAYVAYFGTYTVDAKKSVVTHHVEGALMPDYVGTEQPRPFKLTGDRLEIGDGKTWRRVLERVK